MANQKKTQASLPTSNASKTPAFDSADLTLLAMYHGAYNSISIVDTDMLEELAIKFKEKYPDNDWENAADDWETTIINFYNEHAPSYCKRITDEED